MTTLLAIVACLELGAWSEKLVRTRFHLLERFIVGMVLLSLWPILLGILSILSPRLAIVPLFLLPATSAVRLARDRMASPRQLDLFTTTRSIHEKVILAIVGISLTLLFVASLLPPHGMDALTYHLALPDQYLLRESWAIPRDGAYYLYFQQMEMAFLPLIALDPTGVSANLLVFATLLSLAAGVRRLASGLGDANSGWAAFAAMAASPLLASLVLLTKNDLAASALVVWGTARILDGTERDRLLAAFMLGAAIAIKPISVIAAAPLACLLLMRSTWKGWPSLLATMVALPSIWIARNFLTLGKIVPDAISDNRALTRVGSHAAPGTALGLLLTSVHVVESFLVPLRDATEGPYGPAILLLILLAAFYGRRGNARPILVVAAAGVAAWFIVGNEQARFLLPVVCLGVSAGSAFTGHLGRFSRGIVAATLAANLLLTLWVFANDYGLHRVANGRITVDSFVSRFLDTYRLQRDADQMLPSDASLLAIGEAELFHIHRRADFSAYWEPEHVLTLAHRAHVPEDLRSALIAEGYSHLLYNPVILRNLFTIGLKPLPDCDSDIATLEGLTRVLDLVARDPRTGAAVYRL